MKKIILLILLGFTGFAMLGCNSTREYVVEGENLASANLDDNYRTYYEIFVGAFSDSNEDGMGDLQGIINRLDYLNDGDPDNGKSLGIDGIWLMPIMESNSYHKYDVSDYKSIDTDYGTLEDFAALTAACEARGINVIIDLVLNHTSSAHSWFRAAKAAIRDGDLTNKYIDYYSIVTAAEKISGHAYEQIYDSGYYYECNFSTSMPELNMDNPEVLAEIESIIAFWLNLGVSGFRLDAAKYVYLNDTAKNVAFWNWFMDECKAIKEDVYVVGEVWSGDASILPYYESFSNFDFGMSQNMGAIATTANAEDTVNYYVNYLVNYRRSVETVNPDAILTPFISNHDMNRAAGYLSVTDGRMQMAANLYLLTYGTPFLYYGEEIGMKGMRFANSSTDANRRLAMLWGDKDPVMDPIGTSYDREDQINGTVKDQLNDASSIYNHYKKVIMIRNANPEIARGTYTQLTFTGYSTFGGFLSTYEDSTVGVFHNTSENPITIDLSTYTEIDFSVIRGYAGKGAATLSGQTLTLDGLTSVVIR